MLATIEDAWRGAADDADRASGELVLLTDFSSARERDTALEQAHVFKGAVPGEFYSEVRSALPLVCGR